MSLTLLHQYSKRQYIYYKYRDLPKEENGQPCNLIENEDTTMYT